MRSLLNGKYIILALSVLLLGCNMREVRNLESAGLIVGLASPIQLEPERTIIELGDWVIETDKIDSITVSADLEISVLDTKATITGGLRGALGNLSVWSNGKKDDILLIKSTKTVQTILYKGEGNDVRTKGEFNAWNTSEGIFKKLEDGSFEFKKYLNPGRYQYILVVDGKEMLDPLNTDSVDNGQGGWNSLLISSGPKPISLPKINGSNYDEKNIHLKSSSDIQGIFCYFNNTLLSSEFFDLEGKSLKIQIPKETKSLERSFIRLWAYNNYGVSNDILIPLHEGRVLSDAGQITRHDKEGLVMYFLMLDRFNNGNFSNDKPVNDPQIHPKANYHGGDISGITNKLNDAYFKELGINTLWLSPIAQNPETAYGKYPTPSTTFSGYHGYWPISSSKVDHRYGTSNELQQLVNTAHEKDINVILDYVANHVHKDHPVYQQHPEWATSLYLPDGTLNTER